jgi:hypothetical protein
MIVSLVDFYEFKLAVRPDDSKMTSRPGYAVSFSVLSSQLNF